jgi:HlyD family secretion protein
MNRSPWARRAAGWVLWGIVIVAALGGGGTAAFRYLRPQVVVTEAVEAPVVRAFYSTGTVQPEREFPVKSNTAGILTEVRVDKGYRVKKGEVLAVVSDPGLEFKLREAKAELHERQKLADEKTSPALAELAHRAEAYDAMLDIAQREVDRTRSVLEQNAASQMDLDHALSRLKQIWGDLEATKEMRAAKKIQLEKDVEVAQAAVDTAQWDVDQQTLRAPIDGAVLDRPVSLGTRLAVNDHILQIADVRPANLVMRAQVDEEDVAQVSVKQLVRMTLYSFPGETFTGHVTQIYDKADPDRRTFEVDVRLDKPDPRLAAGMTGELAFILQSKEKAIVVPSQAIQEGAVWVVKDGHLERRLVEVGIKSIERAEILDGLSPGERVILSPATDLKEGQSVRERYMDPAQAAGLNRPAVKTDTFKGFH